MFKSFLSKESVPQNEALRAMVVSGRVDILDDPELFAFAQDVVKVAGPILGRVCSELGKSGVVIGVTRRREQSPIYAVEMGEITGVDSRYPPEMTKLPRYYEFCYFKGKHLQVHIEHSKSAQNGCLADEEKTKTLVTGENVPGGAIVTAGFIISVSGVSSDPNDDEGVAWEIAEAVNVY